MGMSTFTDDKEAVRSEYRNLKRLFEEIKLMPKIDKSLFTDLSMCMSNDYKITIEEGSTMIRIGAALFDSHLKSHLMIFLI